MPTRLKEGQAELEMLKLPSYRLLSGHSKRYLTTNPIGKSLIIFLVAVIFSYSFIDSAALASEFQVNPGDSIQAAVDQAMDGDTITVDPGIYRETVNLTKRIILRGTGSGLQGAPLIDASHQDTAIRISADGSEITGLRVENASVAGIAVFSMGNLVSKNQIRICHDGISVMGNANAVSGNMIIDNTVTDNSDGIVLMMSDGNTIIQNEISNNNLWDSDCGVVLISSDENVIENNNLSQDGVCAVSLRSSKNNTISGNNASLNRWYGIHITGRSSGNRVMENDLYGNKLAGICIEDSIENEVTGNAASLNGKGIFLTQDSYRNLIHGNILEGNSRGIHLAFRSSDNSITANRINGSQYGIYLSFSAARNLIVRNALIDNTYNAYDSGSDNRWDDGTSGNFYSDLGVVYHIPGRGSMDRHPLSNESQADMMAPRA